MKTPKHYLATAFVFSGTSPLYISGLLVADSPNEAYARASRKLVVPQEGDFVSKDGAPVMVVSRTLVELTVDTFNEIFLSGALPVLTDDDKPFARKLRVLDAVKGFKANQLSTCSSLPEGDDLEVVLRSYLRHAKLELTEAEVSATVTLLSQSDPATA